MWKMDRFEGKAKEEYRGAPALVLDLAKAFERVSLPVVWAWGNALQRPKEGFCGCCVVTSSTGPMKLQAGDRKHTSGRVFVAVDSNLGAVVGVEEGTISSIPGNEGRSAQARVNVRGGLWSTAGSSF